MLQNMEIINLNLDGKVVILFTTITNYYVTTFFIEMKFEESKYMTDSVSIQIGFSMWICEQSKYYYSHNV